MKHIRKKMIAVLLSCSLLISGVVGRYETARASGIVAGATVAEIIEGILLSFGISIFTVDMINQAANPDYWGNGWADGNAALQPVYEDLEAEYNRARWEVVNGGGGDPEPSPTPGPEPTTEPDPDPEPVPGEIPTFAEWMAGVVATGIIAMPDEVWDCMGKAVSSLWDKILGRVNNASGADSSLVQDILDLSVSSPGCPYFVTAKFKNEQHIHYFGFLAFYGDRKEYVFAGDGYKYSKYVVEGYDFDYELKNTYDNTFGYGSYFNFSNVVSNAPHFDTKEDADKWIMKQRESLLFNGEVIWVHPDIADTYKNKGKLEYPQQAPRPLQIPNTDQLADTAKKLNPEYNPQYDPSLAPEYIKELIEELRREQNPDPNPDPDPDPNPDPNPEPDPDPNLTPIPTPEPGDGEEGDVNIPDYRTDLTKIFPFCIPFDLIHLLEVMDAPPVPPQFNFPVNIEFKNPYSGKIIFEYHNVFVVDMSVFDDVVKIVRSFEIILFLIGLMMITRSQMIKG